VIKINLILWKHLAATNLESIKTQKHDLGCCSWTNCTVSKKSYIIILSKVTLNRLLSMK